MSKIVDTVKHGFGIAKAWVIAHAPELIFTAGIGFGAAALVTTAKASSKGSEVMNDHLDNLEYATSDILAAKASGDKQELRNAQRAKRVELTAMIKDGLRIYSKPVVFTLASATALTGGFLWQSRRYKIAAATAASTSAILNLVDSNIRKTYGDKAVNAMHDPHWDPNLIREKRDIIDSETGEVKQVDAWRSYEDIKPCKIRLPDEWAYDYNESTVEWGMFYDQPIQQLLFLQSRQHLLNMRLNSDPACRGIFVNQVLDEIGLSKFKSPAGQVSGWVKGDTIDFGLTDYFVRLSDIGTERDPVSDITQDYQQCGDSFWLRLNPRGAILDKLYKSNITVEEF